MTHNWCIAAYKTVVTTDIFRNPYNFPYKTAVITGIFRKLKSVHLGITSFAWWRITYFLTFLKVSKSSTFIDEAQTIRSVRIMFVILVAHMGLQERVVYRGRVIDKWVFGGRVICVWSLNGNWGWYGPIS